MCWGWGWSWCWYCWAHCARLLRKIRHHYCISRQDGGRVAAQQEDRLRAHARHGERRPVHYDGACQHRPGYYCGATADSVRRAADHHRLGPRRRRIRYARQRRLRRIVALVVVWEHGDSYGAVLARRDRRSCDVTARDHGRASRRAVVCASAAYPVVGHGGGGTGAADVGGTCSLAG